LGTPASTVVGRSGRPEERWLLPAASAASLPSLTSGSALTTGQK
jgi:hypothetical protein